MEREGNDTAVIFSLLLSGNVLVYEPSYRELYSREEEIRIRMAGYFGGAVDKNWGREVDDATRRGLKGNERKRITRR